MNTNTYSRYDKILALITRYLYTIQIAYAVCKEMTLSALLYDGVIKLSSDFSCAYRRYARASKHGNGICITVNNLD